MIWLSSRAGWEPTAARDVLRRCSVASERDRWAEWLGERRHGGDLAVLEKQLPAIHEFRDRVLANASIVEGDTVLDVGTGNGLVAFAALPLVGPAGQVIFSDVSQDLLQDCRELAAELGELERCSFLEASADALPLADLSVDVVTTRSVLIYLMDKRPAFEEFFRVLRPGGRISLFEPVNIFGHDEQLRAYYGIDVTPVRQLAEKVMASWKGPEEHPLLNFDERDLLRLAEEAGFDDIRLDYRAEVGKRPAMAPDWETLKRMSGNPLDPTPEEEIAAALTPAERAEFESYLAEALDSQPLVRDRRATMYLKAVKPGG
jgi:arsenite methyltransferase